MTDWVKEFQKLWQQEYQPSLSLELTLSKIEAVQTKLLKIEAVQTMIKSDMKSTNYTELLAFHGTQTSNNTSIVANGFQLSQTRGRDSGAVYLTESPMLAADYCFSDDARGLKEAADTTRTFTKTMLGCRAWVLPNEIDNDIVGVRDPKRVVPVCIITFEYRYRGYKRRKVESVDVKTEASAVESITLNPVLQAYEHRALKQVAIDPRSMCFNQVINGTKLCVLKSLVKVGDVVIDYASGQSADMPKLLRLGVGCILSVDGSPKSLQVAQERQLTFVKCPPKLLPTVALPPNHSTVFLWSCLDLAKQALTLDPCGAKANGILCHNALHYLPISATLKHMSQHLLVEEGYLSILCVDATQLPALEKFSTDVWWKMTHETKTDYCLTIEGLVDKVTERKIYPDDLVQVASTNKFKLVAKRSVWQVYQSAIKDPNTRHIYRWPTAKQLTAFDQCLLNAYCFFSFVKTK